MLLLTYEPSAPAIPSEDDLHLNSYQNKLQLVRDYTRGVAKGFSNGFFLFGTGGIAKSFTVLGELQQQAVDFKLFNSRMSGRGLFEALAEYPRSVHVLEDMERLVNDKDAQGILRSACWGQRGDDGQQKRTITWATARGVETTVFSGGIIMLSNRPLDDLPELRAIKTRISHLHLEVSDQEIAAQMRRLAKNGYKHGDQEMTCDECETICEYVILESQNKLCHLDMRLLDNAFRDFCNGEKVIQPRIGRHSLQLVWMGGKKKLSPLPVTVNWMTICDASKRCFRNIRQRFLPSVNGVDCGTKAEQVFSDTNEYWKRVL